jgi:hypothetical protein
MDFNFWLFWGGKGWILRLIVSGGVFKFSAQNSNPLVAHPGKLSVFNSRPF